MFSGSLSLSKEVASGGLLSHILSLYPCSLAPYLSIRKWPLEAYSPISSHCIHVLWLCLSVENLVLSNPQSVLAGWTLLLLSRKVLINKKKSYLQHFPTAQKKFFFSTTDIELCPTSVS
jgi:hypothetical protein